MSSVELLNYKFSPINSSQNLPTLVFIHGLFGDMNSLGGIVRAFSEKYPTLRFDLRNHGKSFHSQEMNYQLMAEDVLKVLDHLNLNKVILIGHSMGGKTAMKCAILQPHLIEKLIVIDIAPVNYDNNGHDSIFAGLFAVSNAQPKTRQQAKQLLAKYIPQESVQYFLLKSFDAQAKSFFRFNLTALKQNYTNIMHWENGSFDKPTLFIRGALSNYILPQYSEQILAQFPQASSFTINGCGHWVHVEKTNFVIRAIQRFLE